MVVLSQLLLSEMATHTEYPIILVYSTIHLQILHHMKELDVINGMQQADYLMRLYVDET